MKKIIIFYKSFKLLIRDLIDVTKLLLKKEIDLNIINDDYVEKNNNENKIEKLEEELKINVENEEKERYLYNTKHESFDSIQLYRNIKNKDELLEYFKEIKNSSNCLKLTSADIVKYTNLTEWRLKMLRKELVKDGSITVKGRNTYIN